MQPGESWELFPYPDSSTVVGTIFGKRSFTLADIEFFPMSTFYLVIGVGQKTR